MVSFIRSIHSAKAVNFRYSNLIFFYSAMLHACVQTKVVRKNLSALFSNYLFTFVFNDCLCTVNVFVVRLLSYLLNFIVLSQRKLPNKFWLSWDCQHIRCLWHKWSHPFKLTKKFEFLQIYATVDPSSNFYLIHPCFLEIKGLNRRSVKQTDDKLIEFDFAFTLLVSEP